LTGWHQEAQRRAKSLGSLAVWRLATDPHTQAVCRAVDPTGKLGLLADLRRVCAETIAQTVDRRMIRGYRASASGALMFPLKDFK
jgi:hypothetical protein